jgi:hypothetical protein|tara:strand:- start:800 stop:1030 length:231 start_codon:yes stop_codon:yes gene_type:complete
MARDSSYIYPTTVVFKSSNRKNAKVKLKTYKTKNIDEVLEGLEKNILPGIPKDAEILELGVGRRLKEEYISQYLNS